jgi:hypothetical protein
VTLQGDHYHDETLGKGVYGGGDPYHNRLVLGEGYVCEQFLKRLQEWSVDAHDNSGKVKVGGIGISHATIVDCAPPQPEAMNPLGQDMFPPRFAGGGANGGKVRWGAGLSNKGKKLDKRGRNGGISLDTLDPNDLELGGPTGANAKPKQETVNRTHFIVEFVWLPDKPRPKPAAAASAQPGAAVTSAPATTPPKK